MDSTSVVIVAIPSQDDRVWKVSSEKVPHLTLLYLGKQDTGPEMARVAEFIEHAANTSLNKFGMSVERRGELGPENADVIFFEKAWVSDQLKRFRSYLLAHDTINKFYHSVEQYPSWTPHLTLGYPESPAKKTEDEHSLGWVNFDRIALWTGDYEGFEIPLKSEYDLEVAMSDNSDVALSHYGVPGMKWGVHRTKAQIEAASEDAVRTQELKKRAKTSGTNALSNAELRTAIDRMNLETQYSRLSDQTTKKSLGKRFTEALLGDLVKDVVRPEATRVGKAAVQLKVEKGLRERGQADLADRIKPKKK